MKFSDFVGMDVVLSRLKLGVHGPGSVHAYLFCGAQGMGKRSLAEICARAAHCEASQAKPCDVCPSCLRHLGGTHPDHVVLGGDDPIKVDEIRNLIERLSLRPFEGRGHTVIVEQAERMTPQAQNALLKTLEEPSPDTSFFLTTQMPDALLPTIRSRVRPVRFPPVSSESMRRYLQTRGFEDPRLDEIVHAAQGSVGRALQIAEDSQFFALRARALTALSLSERRSGVAGAFATLRDDKDQADELLNALEAIAGDALQAQARGDATSVPGDRLLRAVMRARQMQKSNVSYQSILETLLFSVSEQAEEITV